jgi:hypothetical protein
MAADNTLLARSLRIRYGLLAAAACVAHPVGAQTSIRPFVETRAVATSNDVLQLSDYATWLELAGGLNADINTKRVDGSLNYRVARRMPIDAAIDDKVRHTGDGSIRAEVVRDYLFLNAQGSASIISPTFGGIVNPDSDSLDQQQAFGASVQPTFRHNFGNRIRVAANYRYSLFEVEGGVPPLQIGQPFTLDRPSFGGASDQRSQSASFSIGNSRRSDRFRLELRGDWLRDRIEQLDDHYDSKRLILDGELALNRSISLVGSGGYEDIRNELDSLLVDQRTGLPILDSAGLLQRDPAMPRRVNFDFEGPTWDAGVRLTPTARTGLVVRAGRRFGSFSGSGSFYYHIRSDLTLSGGYQDSINNFGRLYTALFSDPATGLVIPIGTRSGYGGRRGGTPLGAGGCAFGFDPDTQFCRFNLTQIATSAVFRERTGSVTLQKGNEEFSDDARFYGYATAFYTHRRYLGESDILPSVQLPFVPALYLAGTKDVSYGAYFRAEKLLGGNRYATLDVRAQRNEYALSADSKDFYLSGLARYDMLLDRRINLFATAFLSRRFADRNQESPFFSRIGRGDRTEGTVSIGVRYLFSPYRGRFTPAQNERSRQ